MAGVMKNLKHLPYSGAGAVSDPMLGAVIDQIVEDKQVTAWLNDRDIHHQFVSDYRNWILASELNQFHGLGNFPVAVTGQGTTEGFDKFYLKNRNRRFRCYRGEYMYHAAAWRNYFPDWCRIEDDEIRSNDAVVVSMPFSDTGDIHPDMSRVLDECDRLGVPVLVDCAFYGICNGIEFDFDRESITDITFSLSKTFPISHARTGMRLTRTDDDDPMLVHHKTNYVNRISAGIGIELMSLYSADYNTKKWQQTQLKFCQQLDVEPSKCVIFGLGDDNWNVYNRGLSSNRLNFADYLYGGELPNE